MRWQSDRTLLISALLGPAISINGGTQKNKVNTAQTNKQQPMALKSAARFCLMVTFEIFLMKESTFKTLSGRMKDCRKVTLAAAESKRFNTPIFVWKPLSIQVSSVLCRQAAQQHCKLSERLDLQRKGKRVPSVTPVRKDASTNKD